MAKPIPPIFLVEDLDVGIFISLEDAELQLEPFVVQQGRDVAYDAQGRPLRLETDGSRVRISLVHDEPTHAGDLTAILRQYLKEKNEPLADDPTCDLSSLVEACRKFASPSHSIGDLLAESWRWLRRRLGK